MPRAPSFPSLLFRPCRGLLDHCLEKLLPLRTALPAEGLEEYLRPYYPFEENGLGDLVHSRRDHESVSQRDGTLLWKVVVEGALLLKKTP